MPVGKAPDMEKKAILIRNGASFMVNAVQKNLESAGYEVLPVNASVAAVNEKRAEAEILVFSWENSCRRLPTFSSI